MSWELWVASCKAEIMRSFGFGNAGSSMPSAIRVASTVGAVDAISVLSFLLAHIHDPDIIFLGLILLTSSSEVS
jgi:hypothetical protein